MSSFESWIDQQIREAAERGDFDNLPGAGKPLPGAGEAYDENWWVKRWIQREELTDLAPTSLRIKKQAEELLTTVEKLQSEQAVRRLVVDLNDRIELANRGHVDGPPVFLRPFDVEQVVATWRERRNRP
jgi:hypothetical protein